MLETVNLSELVISGTSARGRKERSADSGSISTGNIGVVGTAKDGLGDATHLLFNYHMARAIFGDYDAYDGGDGSLNLVRAIELLYQNGARSVYARALDPSSANQDDYVAAFSELAKDDVNILVAPELSTSDAIEVFESVLEMGEREGRDMIAIVGSDELTVSGIVEQTPDNSRIVMTAPGIWAYDSQEGSEVVLSGTYSAAAVAGCVSTLAPHVSPTNRVISGVTRLSQRFSQTEMTELAANNVAVLEQKQDVRLMRGLTTSDGPFSNIATRRTVDYAKAGIRRTSEPFVGKLVSHKIRATLRGAIESFLNSMVHNGAISGYSLEVTSSGDNDAAGWTMVNVIVQPVYGNDFIAITMTLD